MNQPQSKVDTHSEDEVSKPLTGKAQSKPVKKKVTPRSRKAASAFKTISEVADALDVQQHVLRFWETKFSQIRPLKRGGGRRYYRPEDLALLEKIHHLLYTEGYTIKGVQKLLKEKGKAGLLAEDVVQPENNNEKSAAPVQNAVAPSVSSTGMSASQKQALRTMIQDLKTLRRLVKAK